MTRRDWDAGPPLLGVFLNGAELGTRAPHGERVEDDSFLILFNAHHEDAVFTLPPRRFGTRWQLELTTSDRELEERRSARDEVTLESRALCVYRRK
jgi:isoamylase